jgi:hypothetical protein
MSIIVWDMKKTLINRGANIHTSHSTLLALVSIIFQPYKAYSNLDLTRVKYNNNKLINTDKGICQ